MNAKSIALSITIVLVTSVTAFATPPGGKAGDAIEQMMRQSSYTTQNRAMLMAKTREAFKYGMSPDDVAAMVRKGIAGPTDARTLGRYLALCIEAEQQGLPVQPVLNKILQGMAKGVPSERIITVAVKVKRTMEAAAGIVESAEQRGLQGSTSKERKKAIETISFALETGLPAGELSALSHKAIDKDLPFARFTRVVESMANLKAAGMPGDLVVRTARQFIILRYSEAGIARTEQELMRMKKDHMSWDRAFRRMQAGFGESSGGMDGGFRHSPGSGGGHGKGGK
ncbi:MAG TPA: hypothetical protein DCO77_03405 [Nitrospiraceae bacterium]|nr:hypothetical protein [Nitrospiraceae bacterium]